MRQFLLMIVVFSFFRCSSSSTLFPTISDKPNDSTISSLDSTILERNIDTATAINYGKLIIEKQSTISNTETEVYAHDSKLVILNGVGYCAYYGNDLKSAEGLSGQSVRLSVFDINNPSKKKNYEVFKENFTYKTLKTDPNHPCYTPVLFITEDSKIRLLCKVYEKNIQKYYYRDFDPESNTFSDPQICKINLPNSNNLQDFDLNSIKSSLKKLFGNDYKLSTDFMYATSDPVMTEKGVLLGLTVGKFTADWKTDEGITLILKTVDFGKTFEVYSAPDARKIDSKYNQQFVEGAFDFISNKDVVMIGRNSIGGILKCESNDFGKSYTVPVSLNENCKFNTLGSKPQLIKINNGVLTMWNTTENYGNFNFRTVLEIRYTKDNDFCNSSLKIIIKNPFGCHYPSIYKYNNKYFLTYTTDSRRFNRMSTGEIVFVKLPF